MKSYLKLYIQANEGYDASQATERRSTMTVGELKSVLEDLDDEMEIITYDRNNTYGASYGIVCHDYDTDDYESEEE